MASPERSLHPVPAREDLVAPVGDDREAFEELPEAMWELPHVVADSALRELHSQLIRGLRRDARHLPTGTLHAMQLERIAYYYILIRYNDANESWSSETDKRNTYKLWRDLSSDFNQIAFGRKISPEDLHAVVASHTAKIVANVLRQIPNDQAKPLYAKFAAELDADASQ